MSTTFNVPFNNLLNSPTLKGKLDRDIQQFLTGLSGPTVKTMMLAKVTPTGTEGSISINAYGFITEIVDPT